MAAPVTLLDIALGADLGTVSAQLMRPAHARWLYVFGHGAGAGMHHVFMEAMATRFAARGIATLRYQFPYMEAGRRMPDRAPTLLATVQAAISAGHELAGGLPLLIGGKSMGARMSSMACAENGRHVAGLVYLGFPLHPSGKPGTKRAAHLGQITPPQLFLQGTRDKLADMDLVLEVTKPLPSATVHVVEGADHGFHVLKRSGRTDDQVLDELADTAISWAQTTLS